MLASPTPCTPTPSPTPILLSIYLIFYFISSPPSSGHINIQVLTIIIYFGNGQIISFHNISGKHSAYHGCKLENRVKLSNDIEVLAETWSKCKKCKNTISNYEVLKCIEASKRTGCKRGRVSGGMLLYCKSNLKPSIKILRSSNSHIWYEIGKNLFYNLPDSIKVCSIYSPPGNSNYYTNAIWDELKADIFEFTTNTSVPIDNWRFKCKSR